MATLTDAQVEVIMDLQQDGYGDQHGAGFLRHDVFQSRNNADNAKRRTLTKLISMGAIVATGSTDIEGNPYYKITEDAKALASNMWNKKQFPGW